MASALLRRALFRKSLGSGPPLKRGLPTRRRMLSGGPKWLIEGVPRTRPGNRDFLGFCVFTHPLCSLPPHASSNAVGWPSCPSGLGRVGKSWGQAPLLKRGPPHASSNAVGWPKMAHREGGPPKRGLEIAIFWVSAWSVILRAFLEPDRSVSCKSGLRPGQKGTLPEKPPFKKRPPHASSNAVGWPIMAHHEGGPQDEAWIFWVSACSRTVRTACLPTRRRMLSVWPNMARREGVLAKAFRGVWHRFASCFGSSTPPFGTLAECCAKGRRCCTLSAQRQGSKVDWLRLSAPQGAECCIVCAAPRVEGMGCSR